MLEFFGTILILYIVWLLIKPMLLNYARRQYTKKVNDMFNQAFGQQAGGYNPFGHDAAGRQQPHHRQPQQKKKIFSRDDGEYVEFEEIDVKVETTSESHDPKYTPREPQVSDADWEEV